MKVPAIISISWLFTCGAELSFTLGAVKETLGFVTCENLTQTARLLSANGVVLSHVSILGTMF